MDFQHITQTHIHMAQQKFYTNDKLTCIKQRHLALFLVRGSFSWACVSVCVRSYERCKCIECKPNETEDYMQPGEWRAAGLNGDISIVFRLKQHTFYGDFHLHSLSHWISFYFVQFIGSLLLLFRIGADSNWSVFSYSGAQNAKYNWLGPFTIL